MEMQIGRNIRALRKSRGITQEDLADALNVSFQTVSKWERGESYPDITILPDLSDYFAVSVDELMGLECGVRRIVNREVYKNAHDFVSGGEYASAITLLRYTLKEFPKEYGVMSELALALSIAGVCADEAAKLCECVIENSKSEKLRSTTRACLCLIHAKNGDIEKAVSIARTMPHIWESREMLMSEIYIADMEAYAAELKKSVKLTLSVLCKKIERAEDVNMFEMLTLGAEMDENVSDFISKIAEFLS